MAVVLKGTGGRLITDELLELKNETVSFVLFEARDRVNQSLCGKLNEAKLTHITQRRFLLIGKYSYIFCFATFIAPKILRNYNCVYLIVCLYHVVIYSFSNVFVLHCSSLVAFCWQQN
jgi:hypothetical protein